MRGASDSGRFWSSVLVDIMVVVSARVAARGRAAVPVDPARARPVEPCLPRDLCADKGTMVFSSKHGADRASVGVS